ncbi:MAG: ATP-binding cassette domain-containing protein [Pseudomonadota bacterium]
MTVLRLAEVTMRRGEGAHGRTVLDRVSLQVAGGEIVLIHGPSGSGKTTLLALAAGLLTPDRGEVMIERCALARACASARRRLRAQRVGFVFQRANLLPRLSVRQNVLLQAALAGVGGSDAEKRTDELLAALGLARQALQLPVHLSAGEEQRVAVARALVHRPALVLADEPTASLDGASGRAVAAQLTRLAAAAGAGVLVATHDPRLDDLGERRIVMQDGRLRSSSGREG